MPLINQRGTTTLEEIIYLACRRKSQHRIVDRELQSTGQLLLGIDENYNINFCKKYRN